MENQNNQEYLTAIQAAFGADVLAHEEAFGMLNVELTPARIHDAISWLQQHQDLSSITSPTSPVFTTLSLQVENLQSCTNCILGKTICVCA